jgi:hypothetical protein
MLSSTEYDFCDSKQELDYILNTVNNINHVSIGNSKDLKEINERLKILENKLNDKQEIYFKKDIIFFAIFATLLVAMF